MNDQYLCCDRCFELIAKQEKRHSVTAAIVWMDLCVRYGNKTLYGFPSWDECALQLLEEMGFITTTETDSEIYVVKLNGLHFIDNKYYFCMNNCDNNE